MKSSCDLDLLEARIIDQLGRLVDLTSRPRIDYLKNVLAGAAAMAFQRDCGGVNEFTLMELCSSINKILETRVVGEFDSCLEPCVVVSNHLGANKLVKVEPELIAKALSVDLRENVTGLVNGDSFLLLFCPVFHALLTGSRCSNVYFLPVLMNYPEPYRSFAERMGFVCLKNTGEGNFDYLVRHLDARISAAKKIGKVPVIVMFPEGGTTGKRNQEGAYSLCEFKSGFMNIAHVLGLEIRPVIVKFDRSFRFLATLLPRISRENVLATSVDEIRREMQCALHREKDHFA